MSRDTELKDMFKRHYRETREHESLLKEYFYSGEDDWKKFLQKKRRLDLVKKEKIMAATKERLETVWYFKPNKKGVQAQGHLTDNGFLVNEGSVVADYNYISKDKGVIRYGILRKELEDKRYIVKNVFCKQFNFKSPMEAAVVVFGSWCTQNVWVDENGRCLGDFLGKDKKREVKKK